MIFSVTGILFGSLVGYGRWALQGVAEASGCGVDGTLSRGDELLHDALAIAKISTQISVLMECIA